MIRHVVAKKEPLRVEQEAFLTAVRGECAAAVSGYDGLKALELAQAVVSSGLDHQVITLDSITVTRTSKTSIVGDNVPS
jgi:predicted dehydrogenase